MRKDLQLRFRNGELCEAAMQTDHDLRKNPHDGFIQTFEISEMDGNFAVEHSLAIGMASLTLHGGPPLGAMVLMAANRVLFKIEHLARENDAGKPERIALLVQDNAEKRAVHF